jgi:hypothetical protein
MQFRRLLKAVPAAFLIAAFPRFAAAAPAPPMAVEPPSLPGQGVPRALTSAGPNLTLP